MRLVLLYTVPYVMRPRAGQALLAGHHRQEALMKRILSLSIPHLCIWFDYLIANLFGVQNDALDVFFKSKIVTSII